ncbi:MAG: formylmethanofuran dehydrogenase subunit C, partial [Methanomicrobiaceae archaeon]|nr:formylmethanofuran dehydrogenase subunit C [Methanomicrobiaceae archaeon]
MRVVLELKNREKPYLPIEAESIVPRNFLGPVEDLSVYRGNRELALDQIFGITVEGEASSADEVEVVLRGVCGRIKRIGEYMDAGRIVVEGDIGMHCGNFMSGGEIVIEG